MGLENIFKNLTKKEFTEAENYYNCLKKDEQTRLSGVLEIINNTRLCLEEKEPKNVFMAIIVGGSSIDSEKYSDIDLFLISRDSFYNQDLHRLNPHRQIGSQLNQIKDSQFDAEFVMCHETGQYPHLDSIIPINISLFYELVRFDQRREDKKDDLIEPNPSLELGAEEIIKYNREQKSKFLVLSRQYKLD